MDSERTQFINSLMSGHSKFRDFLTEDELLFTHSLISMMQEADIKLPMNYQIRGGMVNYLIGSYQIGRIELYEPPYRIQILTPSKVKWVVLNSPADAISHIPEWIKYCKKIDRRRLT